MARVQRRTTTGVSTRTMKRRAKKVAAAAEQREVQQRERDVKRHDPESKTQARVWTRKNKRYTNAGLCPDCAAQAAWGHACGFGKVRPPCKQCAPIVAMFDTPGPKGSPWRKCLLRLESLSAEDIAEYQEVMAL